MNIMNFFSRKRKYYFIASVRDAKQEADDIIKKARSLPDDYKYENHDSRCWGFFRSKKKAIQAVTENWIDMNEAAYYHYVIIEPHYEGLISPIIGEEMWFKAKYEKRTDGRGQYNYCVGYEPCEIPEWAKQTYGWAIS